MNEEQNEYIQYRLKCAEEAFEEAEILLKNNHLRGTINRLYYSCFYGASALLLTEELYSKTHSGLKTLFFQHFHKAGKLKIERFKLYQKLFDKRGEGDYVDMVVFDEKEVSSLCDETKLFLNELSELIN